MTSAEQIQKLEHAKRLLKVRLDLIHTDQQRLSSDQDRLWLAIQKIDNELAAIISSHLVDA